MARDGLRAAEMGRDQPSGSPSGRRRSRPGCGLQTTASCHTQVPIWLRNVQLGSLSLLIGACQIAWLDGGAIRAGASLPGLHSAHTSRTAS